MLSFKVTYAIQIFDLLHQSEEGISVSDLRRHFPLLPSGTIISDVVRQMELANLIGKPSSKNRYRIKVALDSLTLYELVQAMDNGLLVLGYPVGFRYWSYGYLDDRPNIVATERKLEATLEDVMRKVTVGELLMESEILPKSPKRAQKNTSASGEEKRFPASAVVS